MKLNFPADVVVAVVAVVAAARNNNCVGSCDELVRSGLLICIEQSEPLADYHLVSLYSLPSPTSLDL